MSAKYRLLLAFWLGLFVASLLILFFSWRSVGSEVNLLPPITGGGQEIDGPNDRPGGIEQPSEDDGESWSVILSAASALISAAGFMATTYFAMRNDRRQTRLAELEIQKLANEVERQRLEIEELRRKREDRTRTPGA